MVSQKKVMKVLVLVILAVFLLSSGLVSVMYFADMKTKNVQNSDNTREILSGEVLSGNQILS